MNHVVDFKDFLECASVGILTTDSKGFITFINKMARKIAQKTSCEAIGMYICKLMPITGIEVMKCIATGEPKVGFIAVGKIASLVTNISVIKKNNQIEGAVCCYNTFEELENTALKLESYCIQNLSLRNIFESSADGILICDPHGKILDVNNTCEQFNAFTAQDCIGKNWIDLIYDVYINRSAVDEAIKKRQRISIPYYVSKTKCYLLVTATPVIDDNGNLSLIIVTERKIDVLDEQHQRLQESLEITEKYKDELAEISAMRLKEDFDIIAKDKHFSRVIRIALKLAHMGASNILILGETGTGKGLLARFIHKSSMTGNAPFIHLNCGAIPENLIEAELFGYEKGAFTGASDRGKAGLIELADKGTLFLDEIGEMPLSVQAKLLKYLDDHQVMRLGSTNTKQVICRIIAATNRSLYQLVTEKRFREDLFYRLDAFRIVIPPLRERRDDIVNLASYFLKKANEIYRQQRRFSPSALRYLFQHPLRGNARQLKNIVDRAVVMSINDLIEETDLKVLDDSNDYYVLQNVISVQNVDEVNSGHDFTERHLFIEAMSKCKTTREIAKFIGTSQPTVVRKMKKFGLSRCSFANRSRLNRHPRDADHR